MLYAFCTQKGGVGKSTIAAHAVIWLAERGKHVALVDADHQASSSIWVKEAAPEVPIYRVTHADDVIKVVSKVSDEYETVIFDGPGGSSEANRAAMLLADVVFLPCGPTVMDLRATWITVELLKQARAIRKGEPMAILIPNKTKRRHRMSKELVKTVQELGLPVSPNIRILDAFAEAVKQGTAVWKMGSDAVEAANDIQSVFLEIFKDEFAQSTVDDRRVENG